MGRGYDQKVPPVYYTKNIPTYSKSLQAYARRKHNVRVQLEGDNGGNITAQGILIRGKLNTNSTPNKSQTQRARAYEITSFLGTDC